MEPSRFHGRGSISTRHHETQRRSRSLDVADHASAASAFPAQERTSPQSFETLLTMFQNFLVHEMPRRETTQGTYHIQHDAGRQTTERARRGTPSVAIQREGSPLSPMLSSSRRLPNGWSHMHPTSSNIVMTTTSAARPLSQWHSNSMFRNPRSMLCDDISETVRHEQHHNVAKGEEATVFDPTPTRKTSVRSTDSATGVGRAEHQRRWAATEDHLDARVRALKKEWELLQRNTGRETAPQGSNNQSIVDNGVDASAQQRNDPVSEKQRLELQQWEASLQQQAATLSNAKMQLKVDLAALHEEKNALLQREDMCRTVELRIQTQHAALENGKARLLQEEECLERERRTLLEKHKSVLQSQRVVETQQQQQQQHTSHQVVLTRCTTAALWLRDDHEDDDGRTSPKDNDVEQHPAGTRSTPPAKPTQDNQLQELHNLKLQRDQLADQNKTLQHDYATLKDELQRVQQQLEEKRLSLGSIAQPSSEEAVMFRCREQFLEQELAKAKNELSMTMIELDQAKLDLMRKAAVEGQREEQGPAEVLFQGQSTSENMTNSLDTHLENLLPDGDHQLHPQLWKELERTRKYLGEQEHEVIALTSDLREAQKQRDTYKQKFELLKAESQHTKLMSRTLHELKQVRSSASSDASDSSSSLQESAILPSLIRSSSGRQASMPALRRNGLGFELKDLPRVPSDQTFNKLSDSESGSGNEKLSCNSSPETSQQRLLLPSEPGPSGGTSRLYKRRGTGFINDSVMTQLKTFRTAPKKPCETNQPTSTMVKEPLMKPPARSQQRKTTGIIKSGMGVLDGKGGSTPTQQGKSLPVIKFSKEDMMKKKLVVKKKSGPPLAAKAPTQPSSSKSLAVSRERYPSLPQVVEALFPIYEDVGSMIVSSRTLQVEMRFLATDVETRAKLFKALVLQLQAAQTSMEALYDEADRLRSENLKLGHSRDMANGLRLALMQAKTQLKNLAGAYQALVEKKEKLEEILFSCQVRLQRLSQAAPKELKQQIEGILELLYKQHLKIRSKRRKPDIQELVRQLSGVTPPRPGAALGVNTPHRAASDSSVVVLHTLDGARRREFESFDTSNEQHPITYIDTGGSGDSSSSSHRPTFLDRRPSADRHAFKPLRDTTTFGVSRTRSLYLTP